jgi:hypothetical protein
LYLGMCMAIGFGKRWDFCILYPQMTCMKAICFSIDRVALMVGELIFVR